MGKLSTIKRLVIALTLLSPLYVSAATEDYSSKLNNQTKPNDPEGYYLVLDKVWSESDCVTDQGQSRINPGESSTLKIKNGCTWGGIRYKIFNILSDKDMGYLAHSFRDGSFSIEITAPCNGAECNFYDLNPAQDRKK